MSLFSAAFWAELLKARRSLISSLTALGMTMLPLTGGLFMIILRDPAAAREMGLISAKAQITAGAADWPSYLGFLSQGTAVAGAVLLALITSWVFGGEFVTRTNTGLLALPTPRLAIVAAKLSLVAVWALALAVMVFLEGLVVGSLLAIPGWSAGLAWRAVGILLAISILTFALMPLVALLAGVGRGFLAPVGWAFFTIAFSQIAAVLGWGDWVPWAVPALLAGAGGSSAAALGWHSYSVVAVAFAGGLIGTITWWQRADQGG